MHWNFCPNATAEATCRINAAQASQNFAKTFNSLVMDSKYVFWTLTPTTATGS
jgi:hypothetical protein